MAAITIRNVNDDLVAAIKRRAAAQGISMEEEVRRSLAATYVDPVAQRRKQWARRQLSKLRRGELPIATEDSAELIRRLRRERESQVSSNGRSRGLRR